MTLRKLIELLQNAPIPPDTEVFVDTPDDTGYFEDKHSIYGVCIYGNDNIVLKCWYAEEGK